MYLLLLSRCSAAGAVRQYTNLSSPGVLDASTAGLVVDSSAPTRGLRPTRGIWISTGVPPGAGILISQFVNKYGERNHIDVSLCRSTTTTTDRGLKFEQRSVHIKNWSLLKFQPSSLFPSSFQRTIVSSILSPLNLKRQFVDIYEPKQCVVRIMNLEIILFLFV